MTPDAGPGEPDAGPVEPDDTEVVDRTIRVDRAARAGRAATPADEPDDDTVVGSRRARRAAPALDDDRPAAPDDDTRLSARARPVPGDVPDAAGAVRTPASEPTPPILRAAYAPDAVALRAGYAARPVAHVPASGLPRAPRAPRAAEPVADSREVDRSIRSQARRRLAWVVVAVAVTLVVLVGLLVALVVSSTG